MSKKLSAATIDPSSELSRSLSWLLRHGAPKEKIPIHAEGYVNIQTILNHQRFKKFSLEDIQRATEENDKQRFAIRTDPETGELQIKATQGHSFQFEDHGLTPITNPTDCPIVIHGTYLRAWDSIRKSGLSRMKRNHIHFATGEPGHEAVISGMRSTAEVYIYIDIGRAIEDGLKFFRSENNVILSPGNIAGVIGTKYFQKVVNIKTGDLMTYPTSSGEFLIVR